MEAPSRQRAARMNRGARVQQLRAVAAGVLAERGIGHANHTQIAAAAGVSLPSMFHYFPTAQDLTRAIISDVSEFLLEGIAARTIASAAPGVAGLEAVLAAFAASFDDNIAFVTIWLDWSTAAGGPHWPDYLDFHEKACAIVTPLVAEALAHRDAKSAPDIASGARVVVGLAHLVAQMRMLDRPVREIAADVARLLRGYFGQADLA